MTPKEKAEELVDKMYNTEHCGIKHFPNKNYCDCSEINYFQAKQCALIAVDEILYVIENPDDRYSSHGLQLVRNWREVKKETEKL